MFSEMDPPQSICTSQTRLTVSSLTCAIEAAIVGPKKH